MPRRRTHAAAVRNRLITIRVTELEHARLADLAKTHGLTLSGLAEKLVTKGKVVVPALPPTSLDLDTLYELKRIGNNLNQIAHAVNSNLPPATQTAANNLIRLLKVLVTHHYFVSRLEAAGAQENTDDPKTAQAREEFQRNAGLRSA